MFDLILVVIFCWSFGLQEKIVSVIRGVILDNLHKIRKFNILFIQNNCVRLTGSQNSINVALIHRNTISSLQLVIVDTCIKQFRSYERSAYDIACIVNFQTNFPMILSLLFSPGVDRSRKSFPSCF